MYSNNIPLIIVRKNAKPVTRETKRNKRGIKHLQRTLYQSQAKHKNLSYRQQPVSKPTDGLLTCDINRTRKKTKGNKCLHLEYHTVMYVLSSKLRRPNNWHLNRHLQDVVPYCLKEIPESIEWARWPFDAPAVPVDIFLSLASARKVSVTSMIWTLKARRHLLQCSLKAATMPIYEWCGAFWCGRTVTTSHLPVPWGA